MGTCKAEAEAEAGRGQGRRMARYSAMAMACLPSAATTTLLPREFCRAFPLCNNDRRCPPAPQLLPSRYFYPCLVTQLIESTHPNGPARPGPGSPFPPDFLIPFCPHSSIWRRLSLSVTASLHLPSSYLVLHASFFSFFPFFFLISFSF